MARALVLEGKVIAREAEQLGVMIELPQRTELVYLTAGGREIFQALHPGVAYSLEVEDGVVQSFRPASPRER